MAMNPDALQELDDTEFQLQWTAKGAEHALLGGIVAAVEKRAADAYVRNRDAVAEAMRNLAAEFRERQRVASTELDHCIAEDKRRSREYTQKLGGDPRRKKA